MTAAVASGAKAVVCASTGNTSASAAAYATVAGLTCAVLVPEGKIAEIIDGELVVSPRPAPAHAVASSALGGELSGPFQRGKGGPGGPGGGFGGPKGGPPQPGQILPPFLQDRLNLTDAQRARLKDLQREVDDKLGKILTDEQRQQLKELRERGPGGFGGGGFGGGKGPGKGPPP